MRKYFYGIVALVLCLASLTGCTEQKETLEGISTNVLPEGFQDQYASVSQIVADRGVLAHSKKDLEEVSDLVVVFTPEIQENKLMYFNDGLVSFGYTKTTGKVEQVLKGDAAEGDSITISEECFVTDDAILHTQGGYLPMKIGESYLLFLVAYPPESGEYDGMYFPADLEYGKYVLSDTAAPTEAKSPLWNAVYEVNGHTNLDKYLEWYRYVESLYPEIFHER